MTIKYTEAECAALDKKLNNPDVVVICPRCHKQLIYRRLGHSVEVSCGTKGCLYDAIRGI